MYFVVRLCANVPTVFHQSLPNRVVSEISSSSKICEPRPLDEGIDDEAGDNITQLVEKQQFILDPCFEKLPVTKGRKMLGVFVTDNQKLLYCYVRKKIICLLSVLKVVVHLEHPD